jgi:hypothetical protein
MLMSPVRFRPDKRCAGDAQQKLKTTDPTSRQSAHPHQQIRNCLKIINKKEIEKLVAGLRCVLDTRTEWPTDRRS